VSGVYRTDIVHERISYYLARHTRRLATAAITDKVPDSKLKIRQRVQWPFQKPKIVMPRAALDAYRSNLALILGTLDVAQKATRLMSVTPTANAIIEDVQDCSHLQSLRLAQRISLIRLPNIAREAESKSLTDATSADDIDVKDLTPRDAIYESTLQPEEILLQSSSTDVKELREEVISLRSNRLSQYSTNPESIRSRVSQYNSHLSQLLADQNLEEVVSGYLCLLDILLDRTATPKHFGILSWV
jgi:hypothetical protein